MRCEDYPCCGHGPAPYGDDGGCPDEDGRFDCVLCGTKLPKGAPSAICTGCRDHRSNLSEEKREYEDAEWERRMERDQ